MGSSSLTSFKCHCDGLCSTPYSSIEHMPTTKIAICANFEAILREDRGETFQSTIDTARDIWAVVDTGASEPYDIICAPTLNPTLYQYVQSVQKPKFGELNWGVVPLWSEVFRVKVKISSIWLPGTFHLWMPSFDNPSMMGSKTIIGSGIMKHLIVCLEGKREPQIGHLIDKLLIVDNQLKNE